MTTVVAPRNLTVTLEKPTSQEGRALIKASDAALAEFFPPEECFSLDAEELDAPTVSFWVARTGDTPCGCVALVDMADYGEIKRLYVAPEARGMRIGHNLMLTLEAHARANGISTIKLESGAELKAAMALYDALGYRPCSPFGGYPDIDSNNFLEKRLL